MGRRHPARGGELSDAGAPAAEEAREAEAALERSPLASTFIAEDPAMAEIAKLLSRLASAPTNVLISGESGTGKDMAAHALHLWGARAALPIVQVDLPSIPASLMESELFGYEAGAFTGATTTKAGKLELARGGTLYLDHVGELAPELQAKLLRVVEDRSFERLGGRETVALEARIVASASADLEEAVQRQLFRRDLFHRLGVFWIRMPPLRERPADVLPLARAFLAREADRQGRAPASFHPEAEAALASYAWPGNVRELKSVVEHGALMSRSEVIAVADLPAYLLESRSVVFRSGRRERPTLDEVEKRYIEHVLQEVGGNQSRAAEILGISRKSLWERRRRYDLK
jgi:DNA-binding NtrC family response regulator